MRKEEQKIENLIVEELSNEKPDCSVLTTAKEMMVQNAKMQSAKPTISKKLCAAICTGAVTILAVCCCIPLMLQHQEYNIADVELTPYDIGSINSYDEKLLSLGYVVESSVLYSNAENSPVYIEERYLDNETSITLYILMGDEGTASEVFSKFNNLTEETVMCDTAVKYVITESEGYAAFIKNYNYYLSVQGSSEQLLSYIDELLN